jgi:hypothetical protein
MSKFSDVHLRDLTPTFFQSIPAATARTIRRLPATPSSGTGAPTRLVRCRDGSRRIACNCRGHGGVRG